MDRQLSLSILLPTLCVVALAGCPMAPEPPDDRDPAPDVVGQDPFIAATGLRVLGYEVQFVLYESSETVPADLIARQEPAPGSLVDPGTLFLLYLSAGPPLRIEGFGPEGVDVAIDERIYVQFNEHVSSRSVDARSYIVETVSGDTISGRYSTGSSNRIYFTPDANLPLDTEIRVTITTAVEGDRFNELAEEFSWTFTVGTDTIAPEVVGFSPTSDQVPRDTLITAEFDEAIDPATVTSENFLVRDRGNNFEPISGRISVNDERLTFRPDAILNPLESYFVELQESITDLFGNAIAPTSWSFSTDGIEKAYAFDFPTAEAIFDPQRENVYALEERFGILRVIDWNSGVVDLEYRTFREGASIAMSPDGSRLYFATIAGLGNQPGSAEFITEIDLDSLEILREERWEISAFDLVVGNDGHLYVSGNSGNGPAIWSFAIESLEVVSLIETRDVYNLGFAPFSKSLYALGGGQFRRYQADRGDVSEDRFHFENSYYSGRLFWMSPGGDYLASGSGWAHTVSADFENDLIFRREISDEPISAGCFAPTLAAFFYIDGDSLVAVDSDLSGFRQEFYFEPNESNFLGMTIDESKLVHVGSDSDSTLLSVAHQPLERIENDAPVAVLDAFVTTVDTWGALKFESKRSTDGSRNRSDLLYAWDWDSDGIIDEPLSSAIRVYNSFPEPGISAVTLTVVDRHGRTDSATVAVEVTGQETTSAAPNEITALEPSGDPQIVFAIDEAAQQLYAINVVSEQIVDSFQTPNLLPSALAYSPLNDEVYVGNRTNGVIDVFDVGTRQFAGSIDTTLDYCERLDVASAAQRLYSGIREKIVIVDLSSLTEIGDSEDPLDIEADTNSAFAVDATGEHMYTYGRSNLHRYDVSGDSFVLEQSLELNRPCDTILLSPDGLHVVPLCVSGNFSGPAIYDFSSQDLDRILGSWYVGDGATSGAFSPTGREIFLLPRDSSTIHALSTQFYSANEVYDFFARQNNAFIQSNSDGSMIVAYTGASTSDDSGLRFFPAP